MWAPDPDRQQFSQVNFSINTSVYAVISPKRPNFIGMFVDW